MNANPHTCPHNNLTYDGTFAIVRCMDCDTTWDADEPVPMHMRGEAARSASASDSEHPNNPSVLNPDNEPTSEHNTWQGDQQ